MKVAGYILLVIGIIGGVAIMIAGFAEQSSGIGFLGILLGGVSIYFSVCSSLSIIYAADIPVVQGTAEHALTQAKSNVKELNKVKDEIKALKQENRKLVEKILELQEKMN